MPTQLLARFTVGCEAGSAKCGDCNFRRACTNFCEVFRARLDGNVLDWQRLPECLEAERAADEAGKERR